MVTRLSAVVILSSIILMGTANPAEACAIWCLGTHGGHEHHEVAARGMVGHHHAGMTHMRPVSMGSRLCETNCSVPMVAGADKSLVVQEKYSGEWNPPLGDVAEGAPEREGDAVVHFEVAGPPGLASCGKSILRI